MDLGIIRKLSEKRAGGMRKLAADIGMSEANLHRCINNNKMQAGDFEAIANHLGVSVGLFFGEGLVKTKIVKTQGNYSPASMNGNVSVHSDANLSDKVKYLEQLLAEKERTIKILMERK